MGRGPKQTFLKDIQTFLKDIQKANRHMKRCSNNQHLTNYQQNANQNYNEVPPHTGQNGHHQSLQVTNAREGVEKREYSYTVGGNVNWFSHCEKEYEVSSKN